MDAFKTINHVVTSPGIGRSAWFKEPDGNTIALFRQYDRALPAQQSCQRAALQDGHSWT